MGVLAAIRPDAWNFPLFVHVLGAMLLVGATLTGATTLALAHGDPKLVRLGYRTLLVLGLPSYALMWVGAHWIYMKEGLDERPLEFAWEAIGFAVTEVGAVLFVTALVLGGIGVRRLPAGGADLLKATNVICLVLLAGFAVAIWAMAAKPT
jgi:heme/copper-type cytochrome/quinol oxidase subunit 1